MIIATLSAAPTATNQKQPECLSMGEGLMTVLPRDTRRKYAVIKKNEVDMSQPTQMSERRLNERSELQNEMI